MPTSNTLTGIIPTIYTALNVVSREMVGFIPAVSRDAKADRAALNQAVRSPIGEAGELEDITPGQNPAASGGTTVDYVDVTITKSKAAPILWSGEESLSVGEYGQYDTILADQFADGMRKLVNAVEIDLALAAVTGASRAYGTAGTTPFGTAGDLSDFAGVSQILDDNGCPNTDRQLVIGSAAMANLRGKQSVLFKVNEAGTNDMLRNGMTDRVQGFALRNSAGFRTHTKGTGANFDTNLGASLAIGDTSIAVDTGTGTILAGDIVTFAGDANKYVVGTALSGGAFALNDPGLRAALADGVDVTLGNSYTPNVAFARTAIVLASRAPAIPKGGDSADDAMIVTDPISGISFEVRVYRQYRQVKYEVCLAWGVKAVKSAHIATMLG
jgi:hypothetical protein